MPSKQWKERRNEIFRELSPKMRQWLKPCDEILDELSPKLKHWFELNPRKQRAVKKNKIGG